MVVQSVSSASRWTSSFSWSNILASLFCEPTSSRALWPKDVFVDVETGVNTAVRNSVRR